MNTSDSFVVPHVRAGGRGHPGQQRRTDVHHQAPPQGAVQAPMPFPVADLLLRAERLGRGPRHSRRDRGGPWTALEVESPSGRTLLEIVSRSRLRMQGLTQLAFESAEPTFAELDPADFFRRFPEGRPDRGRGPRGRDLREHGGAVRTCWPLRRGTSGWRDCQPPRTATPQRFRRWRRRCHRLGPRRRVAPDGRQGGAGRHRALPVLRGAAGRQTQHRPAADPDRVPGAGRHRQQRERPQVRESSPAPRPGTTPPSSRASGSADEPREGFARLAPSNTQARRRRASV